MLLRQRLQSTTALMVLMASTMLPTGFAFAQQTGLEEIVVTARKVEENLMQVPLAISAVTAQDIQESGVKNLIDLGKFTPGLFASVSGNGRTDRFAATHLTFRGLSVASGLIFIDGVPFAGSDTPDFSDVARVEVLKGPQAVYFGRSTYSGAVNYVPREPSADRYRGQVQVDISSFSGNIEDATLEGPIAGDKLTARVSVHHYYTGGQYPNPLEGDRLGEEQTTSVKGYLVFKPNDNLKMSAWVSWAEDEDGTPTEAVLINNTANGLKGVPTQNFLNCNLGGTGGPFLCGQIQPLHYYTHIFPNLVSVYDRTDPTFTARILQNVPVVSPLAGGAMESYPRLFSSTWLNHFGLRRDTTNAHLKMDWQNESGWNAGVVAAYDRTKAANIVDQNYQDGGFVANPFYGVLTQPLLPPNNQHPLLTQQLTTDYTVEGRITSPQNARLRGTAGVNYLAINNPTQGSMFTDGYGVTGTIENAELTSHSRTPALFAGLYFDIMPKLTLSAEGRYQWDKIYQQQLWPTVFPATPLAATYGTFSPRVSLDYKYADNSDVYALYSKGYRPGGFNTLLVSSTPAVIAQLSAAGAQLAYQQETLTNWEVGLKSTWLDNRVRTTLAGYVDQWRNGQVQNSFFTVNPDGTITNPVLTTNIGQVNLKGIEAEAQVAVTQHFTVSGTMDWEYNKIIRYQFLPDGLQIDGTTNVNGHRLPQVPAWTWSVSPEYTDVLVGDWNWFARLDWTHRGRFFTDASNVAWLAPLDLVNLHIGVASSDRYRIEGYVTNLFNNDNIPEAVTGGCCHDVLDNSLTSNAIRIGVPYKRAFGVKVTYTF